ncbi:hypothetical protein D3C80_1760670 [compost metagenome]
MRSGADGQHAEVMRQQLFKDQAFLCRVLALFQISQLDIRRRTVQHMQRLRQAHQATA